MAERTEGHLKVVLVPQSGSNLVSRRQRRKDDVSHTALQGGEQEREYDLVMQRHVHNKPQVVIW